ncbi:MAG: hypothetical protein V1777_00170 [Candidatus Micrarchaeota archaeon]
MVTVAGLDSKKLKKTCILFGFEDVLVPNGASGAFNEKPVLEILKNLSELEKKDPNFHFGLLTGLPKEKFDAKVAKTKLAGFFDSKKIFSVDQSYLDSKSKMDLDLYQKNVKANPEFKDEYFKQIAIDEVSERYSVPKEKMVYVGNDLLFAAFYTSRYSKIDVALIKDSVSLRGEKTENTVSGLIYINRNWKDIQKLLLGKFSPVDYSELTKFIQKWLEQQLLKTDSIKLIPGNRKKTEQEKQNESP